MTSSNGTSNTRTALLEATLRVIAKDGFRSVTHRKIAKEAGVSLSATSYHLSNMDSILYESMELFVEESASRYSLEIAEPATSENMSEAIVQLVTQIHRDRDDVTLTYELYAQAARDDRYGELVKRWSGATFESLCRFYSESVAAQAEAALEGLIFLRMLSSHPMDEASMRSFINAILEGNAAGKLDDDS